MNAGKYVALAAVLLSNVALARNIGISAVSLSESKRAFSVVDLDTIRNLNSYRRAWVYTFVKQGINPPLFVASLREVDCAQERFQDLQEDYYKQDHSFDFSPKTLDGWAFAPPGSINNGIIQVICGTRTLTGDSIMGDVNPFVLMDRMLSNKRED